LKNNYKNINLIFFQVKNNFKKLCSTEATIVSNKYPVCFCGVELFKKINFFSALN
jgi:hypothetical protein